jgi:hypothetical protein
VETTDDVELNEAGKSTLVERLLLDMPVVAFQQSVE